MHAMLSKYNHNSGILEKAGAREHLHVGERESRTPSYFPLVLPVSTNVPATLARAPLVQLKPQPVLPCTINRHYEHQDRSHLRLAEGTGRYREHQAPSYKVKSSCVGVVCHRGIHKRTRAALFEPGPCTTRAELREAR